MRSSSVFVRAVVIKFPELLPLVNETNFLATYRYEMFRHEAAKTQYKSHHAKFVTIISKEMFHLFMNSESGEIVRVRAKISSQNWQLRRPADKA
jgi:hypothetical protein